MPQKDILETLKDWVHDHHENFVHNHKLFEIYQGNLEKFVTKAIIQQLSQEASSFAVARENVTNVLTQIIDKLSKIYAKPPKRTVVEGTGTEKDIELLEFYEKNTHMNQQMNLTNELFNLHKSVTFEPHLVDKLPRIRVVPSDRSIWYSDDFLNPMNPTHYVKMNLTEIERGGKKVKVHFVYSDDRFYIVDEAFEPIPELMAKLDNPDGINAFGAIPGVYVNRSHFDLVPQMDTDLFKMTLLIPVILSDLNFAAMMQAFSIIYMIDGDDENAKMSPNALWNLQSKPGSDKQTQIGMIKPQVDIDSVINLVVAQLSMWLKSKNLRPGTVGDMSASNAASGIAKIIDETDTSEDRTRQIQYFKPAEEQYWNLITEHMHPYWRKKKMIDTNLDWTKGVKIQTEFTEQLPLIDRSKVLDDAIKELNAGLTLPEIAIQRLNPEMTESESNELLDEIEKRKNKTQVIESDEPEDDESDTTENEQQSFNEDEAPMNEGDNLSGGTAES